MNGHDPRAGRLQRWKTILGVLTGAVTLLAMLGGVVVWGGDQRWQRKGSMEQMQGDVKFLTQVILERQIVDLDVRIDILESRETLTEPERRELHSLRLKRDRYKQRLQRGNTQ